MRIIENKNYIKTISITGTGNVYYKFEPLYTGGYEFLCMGSSEISCAIIDCAKENIINSAFQRNSKSINVASTLIKNRVYYIRISNEQENEVIMNIEFQMKFICKPESTHFNYQWGILNQSTGIDINLLPAWCYVSESKIRIGIADTGINYDNINLKRNINRRFSYDFVYEKNEDEISGLDDRNHGTHLAGIIAGYPINKKGIIGILRRADIISLKIFCNSDRNKIYKKASHAFVSAIQYAQRHNIRVINCSFSGDSFSREERDAMRAANDILFVIAAGNNNYDLGEKLIYPPCYELDNSIVVAAIDQHGNLYEKSNYGCAVDIAAPGDSIVSLYSDNSYYKAHGTSMAAPFVTGVCSMLFDIDMKLTPSDVKKMITCKDNVTELPSLKGKVKSGGILNAYKVVTSLIKKSYKATF